MAKRLVIKQVVADVDAEYLIRNMDNENDQAFFEVGADTPTLLPGAAGQALKVSCAARYWVLDAETHIVGQNGKVTQTGYAGDYLVEEDRQTIRIYKREEFSQFFITQAGKNPTIHKETVGEALGVAGASE